MFCKLAWATSIRWQHFFFSVLLSFHTIMQCYPLFSLSLCLSYLFLSTFLIYFFPINRTGSCNIFQLFSPGGQNTLYPSVCDNVSCVLNYAKFRLFILSVHIVLTFFCKTTLWLLEIILSVQKFILWEIFVFIVVLYTNFVILFYTNIRLALCLLCNILKLCISLVATGNVWHVNFFVLLPVNLSVFFINMLVINYKWQTHSTQKY